jgi:hypothetical protein
MASPRGLLPAVSTSTASTTSDRVLRQQAYRPIALGVIVLYDPLQAGGPQDGATRAGVLHRGPADWPAVRSLTRGTGSASEIEFDRIQWLLGRRRAAEVDQAAVEQAGSTRLAVAAALDGPVDPDRARARIPCRCRVAVPRDPWGTRSRCPGADLVVHVAPFPLSD